MRTEVNIAFKERINVIMGIRCSKHLKSNDATEKSF